MRATGVANISVFLMVMISLFVIQAGAVDVKMKAIVVLISGCRWDYINDPHLKGIRHIIENGVRTTFVTPVYPADSYPNWYSLATGLYPESHGFVSDTMYDEEHDEFFLAAKDPNNTKPFWWNEAEPVWITAEANDLRTALYWWAGCEVAISGKHPTISEVFRPELDPIIWKMDMLQRVEDVMQMFKSDELTLAMIHYGDVGVSGRKFGPNSLETQKAVYDIDDILDTMQRRITEEGLSEEVNIIVVSDHGLASVNEENTKYFDIEKFSKFIKYQVSYGTSSMILPQPDMLDKLFTELKHADIKGLSVYKKEDIPPHYHLKNSKRVLPLLLQADKGFYINPLNDSEKVHGVDSRKFKGMHGYDPNEIKDMGTIFFAMGPVFQNRVVTPHLHNVDLYEIICHAIGLDPLPNNGSLERINSMFVNGLYMNNGVQKQSTLSIIVTIIFIALVFS